MNVLKPIAVASLLFFLSTGTSNSAISKCGLIAAGEVWLAIDSPVQVTCDLAVADLSIEPGVVVEFIGNYRVVVNGRIQTLGTPESPVVFRPSVANAAGWGGFFFEDTIGGSAFVWTEIEGATSSAVHLVRSTPSFDSVTFKNNAAENGGALRVQLKDEDLRLNGCVFIGNHANTAGGAIYAVGPTGEGEAALAVTDSVFLENTAGTTGSTQNTHGGAIFANDSSLGVRYWKFSRRAKRAGEA